jgi:hypothetical protein
VGARRVSAVLVLLVAVAACAGLVVAFSACSSGEEPAAAASAPPALPTAVATVSADGPRQAFHDYMRDRVSTIPSSGFPGARWDFRSLGPQTDRSAAFLMTVTFLSGTVDGVDSWATYSVTRDHRGSAWRITRTSPPAQRVLPAPLQTVGP